jgi:hypothetical protein
MYAFIVSSFLSFLVTSLLIYIFNVILNDDTVECDKPNRPYIFDSLDNILTNELIKKSDSDDDKQSLLDSPPTSPSPQPVKRTKTKIPTNNNTFDISDIIMLSFTHSNYDSDDSVFERPFPGRRSISTYGAEPLEPEENVEYIITNIVKQGHIPNHKGAPNLEKSFNNTDTFIYVYPKKQFDEMNGGFTHTHDIFWFINIDQMTVCQYEDAYTLQNILQITKTGTLD